MTHLFHQHCRCCPIPFFEAGINALPRDYPSVGAYDGVTNERAEQEKADWERTLPAKKPNYDKSGTRSPWVLIGAWYMDWTSQLRLRGVDKERKSCRRHNGNTREHPTRCRCTGSVPAFVPALRGARVPMLLLSGTLFYFT